jgi:hypothetical protein
MMIYGSSFDPLWQKLRNKDGGHGLPPSPVSEEFAAEVEKLIFEPLGAEPTRAEVADAKYWLQELYQDRLRSLPPSPRSVRSWDHRCLDVVYQASYDRLYRLDQTLDRDARRTRLRAAQAAEPPAPNAPVLERIVEVKRQPAVFLATKVTDEAHRQS